MAYTTIDDPAQYFNTLLYTGNGATSSAGTTARTLTGVGFQPDWVWVKERSNTEGHFLQDSVRGASKVLFSNLRNAEVDSLTDYSDGGLNGFTSDGFTIGSGHAGNSNNINTNSETYVAWNWKAGTAFTNDASSTGIGSLDSAGSVNETAGFSIVTYSAVGANHTVKHGLSTTPHLIIFKSRNSSSQGWVVFHQSIANTKFVRLNETDGANTSTDGTGNFNSTSPTSSVFSIGTALATGENGKNIVCYCFSERKGYSKFGSYTGNGNADGTFVYTGFKPAWVMVKRTDSTGQWGIADNKRGVAPSGEFLFAEDNGSTNSASNNFDFLSNGFKSRADYAANNTSSATYIYLAFAESPFVNSNGVPTNAR